jgi:hypothetical protein
MSKPRAYFILLCFALAFVYVAVREWQAGTLLTTIGVWAIVALIGVWVLGIATFYYAIADKIRYKRNTAYRLPAGMTKADVLAQALYAIVYFTEDEGSVRIYDKRTDSPVHWANSQAEAEAWIIKRYLAEQTHEQTNHP